MKSNGCNMNNILKIRALLAQSIPKSKNLSVTFFKTGAGHYAEHDKFIGVNVPTLRKIAKEFSCLTLKEIKILLSSSINQERLLALFILIDLYKKSDTKTKETIYKFYMKNLKYVNNWNLVDASAHLILGAHLLQLDKSILLILAKSEIMWERRIAIVATWYFIRNNNLAYTFKIAKILRNDDHDLIHKAVGWMLREAGKRNISLLIQFLDIYATKMPRTMLRYAIEKFPETKRKAYLKKC